MPTGGVAGEHCAAMLRALGWPVERAPGGAESHPDLVWAASGAMLLTGLAAGPPLLTPAPLASCARAAIRALGVVAGDAQALAAIDGAQLLGERAACLGLRRRGAIAPGGACRLVRARDAWLAVNLARPSDVELLPAWLDLPRPVVAKDGGVGEETWRAVQRVLRDRRSIEVVARARLLGMPVAHAGSASPLRPASWFRCEVEGRVRPLAAPVAPLVVDLSALWAGPLAASLLGAVGARVIKVESTRRPDGARRGSGAFHDLLNAGKESVALDLASADGRAALAALLGRADIVVESARPRALRHLGIDAAALVRSVPGLVWVSITGYGRGEPEGGWVAFGDDAGVAAGLAIGVDEDAPVFCGDAIADPLAGMHAAVAALAAWRRGRGGLLEVPLCDVAAYLRGVNGGAGEAAVRRSQAGRGTASNGDCRAARCAEGGRLDSKERRRPASDRDSRAAGAAAGRWDASNADDAWEVVLGDDRQSVCGPTARPRGAAARALGADTAAVLAELT